VTIEALGTSTDTTVENGSIIFQSPVTKQAGSDATITLKASKNVNMDSNGLSSTSSKLNVIVWTDSDSTNGGGAILDGPASGYLIDTNGGHLSIGGGSASTSWNSLTIPSGYAQANQPFGSAWWGIELGVNQTPSTRQLIRTSGGNLRLYGDSNSGTSSVYGIAWEGGEISTGSGSVELNGKTSRDTNAAGGANYGVGIGVNWATGDVPKLVTSGSVTITGTTAGTYDGHQGVYVAYADFNSATSPVTITSDRRVQLGTSNTFASPVDVTSSAKVLVSGAQTINSSSTGTSLRLTSSGADIVVQGSVTATGGVVTSAAAATALEANISAGAQGISIRSVGRITGNAGASAASPRLLGTTGGPITLWTTGSAGGVALANFTQLNTTQSSASGADITIGGGSASSSDASRPSGNALSSAGSAVVLGTSPNANVVQILSGTGSIVIRGEATAANISHSGVYVEAGTRIIGSTVDIFGKNVATTSDNAHSAGVYHYVDSASAKTLIEATVSSTVHRTALSITGQSTNSNYAMMVSNATGSSVSDQITLRTTGASADIRLSGTTARSGGAGVQAAGLVLSTFDGDVYIDTGSVDASLGRSGTGRQSAYLANGSGPGGNRVFGYRHPQHRRIQRHHYWHINFCTANRTIFH
jgi:hypothetical protein